MNPASKDISTLLKNESSLALTFGTDLFFARMPDEPSDCVAVLDNPGRPPMLTYKKETSNYFYSSVTVWVRNTDYAAGWAQIHEILTFLHGLGSQVVDGTYYDIIKAMADPQLLYWDENQRAVFIVNFTVQRREN